VGRERRPRRQRRRGATLRDGGGRRRRWRRVEAAFRANVSALVSLEDGTNGTARAHIQKSTCTPNQWSRRGVSFTSSRGAECPAGESFAGRRRELLYGHV